MAKRILLVEDYEDALSILVLIVRSFGYETIEAATGADVVEKAFFENPNLIVMNMSLPDMTGIDAAKAIQAHRACLSLLIPVGAGARGWSKRRTLG
jgi:CheY-like chemotaxis protein